MANENPHLLMADAGFLLEKAVALLGRSEVFDEFLHDVAEIASLF